MDNAASIIYTNVNSINVVLCHSPLKKINEKVTASKSYTGCIKTGHSFLFNNFNMMNFSTVNFRYSIGGMIVG